MMYSAKAIANACKIPSGNKLESIKVTIINNEINSKVNMNNLEPCSSVFSQDAPIDLKTFLFSNIICAANKENLADR